MDKTALLGQFCPGKLEVKTRQLSGGISMGGRDKRHRETKKSKKTSRPVKVEALVPSVDVEVVRKKKQRPTLALG